MRNPGHQYDVNGVLARCVHLPSVRQYVRSLCSRQLVTGEHQAAWLLRAVTCIDLTTLAGDDTSVNVARLCYDAAYPLPDSVIRALTENSTESDNVKEGFHCAAVCVYPARVADAVSALSSLNVSHIPVASVATGFPSGLYALKTRLEEIEYAVEHGATEIDIVINRQLVLSADWQALFDEVTAMRVACGEAHMKTILAVGELGSMENVYRASMICMMAGADFIKTSTGKESVNATLEVGVVMCRAIKDYYNKTGFKVGLKPAGGILNGRDAILWLALVSDLLGREWLHSGLFRLGASSLLTDLQKQLCQFL